MKISYNTIESSGSTTSSRISEIWFSKKGFSDGEWKYWDICYKIDKTMLGVAPYFPYLMEYNRYDQDDIKIYTDEEKNPTDPAATPNFKYLLGECLTLSEVTISKVIFPKKLLDEGYRFAVIFDQLGDSPAFNDWYKCHTENYVDTHTGTSELRTLQDWFKNNYKYRIYVDDTADANILDRDTVIQFMTSASSNSENTDIQVLTAVHESNYSNPHLEQITTLSTQIFNGNIVSTHTFNQTYKTPNAFLVGNQLFNEDFSMRYIGDYLYLVDNGSIIWTPDPTTWAREPGTIPDKTGRTVYSLYLMKGQTGLMQLQFVPVNTKNQLADFELYSVKLQDGEFAGPDTILSGSGWNLIQDSLSSDCRVVAPNINDTNSDTSVCVCLKDKITEYFYVSTLNGTITNIQLTLNENI